MLTERGRQIRLDIIKLSKPNGGYHYGGSFSCVEILIALFDKVMDNRWRDGRDRFILSKGHACWGLYVLLRERGLDPALEGHPKRDVPNGIECTTGSMGHGLPTAVGMAMAKKLKGDSGKVYVLVGDGECQEGTTWESLLIASQHKLDNLWVIVDCNGIQGSGRVDDILRMNLLKVADDLGWSIGLTLDGNSVESILDVFDQMLNKKDNSPKFIIAETIKGKGVSFMEDKPEWHAKWLDDEHEKLANRELMTDWKRSEGVGA